MDICDLESVDRTVEFYNNCVYDFKVTVHGYSLVCKFVRPSSQLTRDVSYISITWAPTSI